MNARFNSMFLNQMTFDSASPIGSAVVVHRIDDEGEYDVELGREDETPDRMGLSVGPQAKKASPRPTSCPLARPIVAVRVGT